MTAVWEGRWAELVRRITARKETTDLNLITDLMPVLVVNDPAAPENALPRRERWCVGRGNVTSAAGNYAQVGITNPASSGKLVVLERMNLRGTAGVQHYARVLSAPLAFGATSAEVQNLDGRGCTDSVTPGPIAQVGTRDSASALSPFMNLGELAAASSMLYPDVKGIVLPPGWQFLVSKAAVGANQLECTFWWRERTPDPAELAGPGA